MNIEKHIGSLLFHHDCVIIPGFGGFVSKYSPAQIHPTQHTFSPPSKSIVFNRSLKNNDGLLANFISQEEHISYSQALEQVNAYATQCAQTLLSGKRLFIAEVGELFPDIEKNIQFEPDSNVNYLLESFGLTALQSPSIKRENFIQRLEKAPKDREVVPAEIKRRIHVKKYVALTLSAAAIFAMVYIPLGTNLLKGVNYANLNPFAKKEKSTYTEHSYKENLAPVKTLMPAPVSAVLPDTAKFTSVSFSKTAASPLVVRAEAKAEVESTAVANTASEKISRSSAATMQGEKYSIIGGCFAISENADHFVDMLKSQGFDAFILETNKSSLRHVSYGSYKSYGQAVAALHKVRASNKDAWMLIK
jgi:cell division septation protein DedD